jgi:hypothetical protein
MIKVSSQQKRKLQREMGNNKWYVKDWQVMKFIGTENDATSTGTIDIYANNMYSCIKRNNEPPVMRLSIKRNDIALIHNWQHLQHIKNDICGDEYEAIGIYPPISRILDHMWVLSEVEYAGISVN